MSPGDQYIICVAVFHASHARNVEERTSQWDIYHTTFAPSIGILMLARPAQVTVWLEDLIHRIWWMNTQPVRNLIKRKPSRSKIIVKTTIMLQQAHDTS